MSVLHPSQRKRFVDTLLLAALLAGGLLGLPATYGPLANTAQAGSFEDAKRDAEDRARGILQGAPYRFEVVSSKANSNLTYVNCEVVRRNPNGQVFFRRFPYFRVQLSGTRLTLEGPFGL